MSNPNLTSLSSDESNESSLEERILFLLGTDETCRNDDKYLIFLYWQKYQSLPVDPAVASAMLRNSESIRRFRQKIQERGDFLPTDPVVAKKRGREVGI